MFNIRCSKLPDLSPVVENSFDPTAAKAAYLAAIPAQDVIDYDITIADVAVEVEEGNSVIATHTGTGAYISCAVPPIEALTALGEDPNDYSYQWYTTEWLGSAAQLAVAAQQGERLWASQQMGIAKTQVDLHQDSDPSALFTEGQWRAFRVLLRVYAALNDQDIVSNARPAEPA